MFKFDFDTTLACIYRPKFENHGGYFKPITQWDTIPFDALIGIDSQLKSLQRNTQKFLEGTESCNALLWGARGCGKSSAIKCVLGSFLRTPNTFLRVIEIPKNSLGIMPLCIDFVRDLPYAFILICDDLSFNANDESYKALKSVLEGSFEQKTSNVLLYATSNQRHLVDEAYPQDTMHLNDAHDELLALSDRFGLTLGFYTLGTQEFLSLIRTLLETYISPMPSEDLWKQKALNFASLKGSKNPRIAREFCLLYKNGIL